MGSNVLGDIGEWVAGCVGGDGGASGGPPSLSFRHDSYDASEESVLEWRHDARASYLEAMLMPKLAPLREAALSSVEAGRAYELDGVTVQELSWQLPYGARTQALYLAPAGAEPEGSLPALLALHCHGGQKVFGLEKITRTDAAQHPAMEEHQATYYGGRAWANEMAKRGYAVLVHDAFPFGSRRVTQESMPDTIRQSCVPTEFQDEAREAAAQRAAAAAAAPPAEAEQIQIDE